MHSLLSFNFENLHFKYTLQFDVAELLHQAIKIIIIIIKLKNSEKLSS